MPSERKADRPSGLLTEEHRELDNLIDALSRPAYRVPRLRTKYKWALYRGHRDATMLIVTASPTSTLSPTLASAYGLVQPRQTNYFGGSDADCYV